MQVIIYTLEDADGQNPAPLFGTQDYQEARGRAASGHLRVIANEFEFSDSEMVDDFTSRDNDE